MTSRQFSLLIAVLFALIIFSCKNISRRPVKEDVVAANMDTTVNPGDDFAKYAHGKWIKNNPIPAAYSRWDIGNLVDNDIKDKLKKINEDAMISKAAKGSNDQKVGDFYFSGMDTVNIEKQGIKPLQQTLDKINAIKDVNGLLDVVAELYKNEIRTFFDMDVYQDQMNSEVYGLYFTQGGLGLPNRDYYFNTDKRTTGIRDDYRSKHLPAMLKFTNTDPKSAESVFKMETALASKSRKLEDLQDPYANYNKMSMAQFSKKTPNINWTTLMQKMGVPKVDSVIIGQPEFFVELDKVIKTTPIEDLKAYIKWRFISQTANYLNKEIDDESFRFYGMVVSGKKEQLPRWKRILDDEEEAMGELLGQQFVKEYFPEKTKKRYEDLVDAIMLAYKERIDKLSWMSKETKQKAQLKLSTITKKIGYPEKWKDFSSLQFDRGAYVQNILRANNWWYKYNINKLGKPVDRSEWDMTPQTYNAYYNPSNNEIVLPAAIFTIPGFKDDDVDDAVIYGYAGASTIGHEITHGFDDAGRQYDEKGNLFNWWTKADEEQFNKRADMMVEQFNNIVVLDSMHINGKATLGENLADYGGILFGIDAFKKTEQYKKGEKIAGLTPMQRYFLGYALGWMGNIRDERLANQVLTDVHSPAFLRINGPFANIPEFYEAFGVKPGQPMWRPDSLRVQVW